MLSGIVTSRLANSLLLLASDKAPQVVLHLSSYIKSIELFL